MNILYIAVSCSPTLGSESKVGWTVPLESSKTNNVFVLTRGEAKDKITAYLEEHPNKNLHFFYIDIPNLYYKIFKGPFRPRILNIWHRHAYSLAEEICRKEKIDIIHQITPIEFRSIGNYWKIPNTKFVVGPLGGGVFIPKGLRSYVRHHWPFEAVRIVVNYWYKLTMAITRKLDKCDCVLFVNAETAKFIGGGEGEQIHAETAIDIDYGPHKNRSSNTCCTFLVVGSLIYGKGLMFLLDTLEHLPEELSYQCRIIGDGAEKAALERRVAQSITLKEHITFVGKVPHKEMEKEYQQGDILIFPTLKEATGSVILEAMAHGIPVITINAFGGSKIVTDEIGWLYSGNSKEEYITNLCATIQDCLANPEEVRRKGENAYKEVHKYSWDELLKYYNEIYGKLLTK